MAIRSDRQLETPGGQDPTGAAVDSIYRTYRNAVRRYVARTFGPGPPDPEDVVQAAFERFAQITAPAAIENPYSFLVRCARNHVIDQKRRQRVRAEHAAEVQALDTDADDLDAERVLSSRQSVEILASALAGLDQRRREMLLMNRVEGLSYVEIARQFGCSDSLVKLRVGEAILICRTVMDKKGAR